MPVAREEKQKVLQRDLEQLISLTEASSLCPYSQEYLSLLARRGLIDAVKLGRNWVISRRVLFDYVAKNSEVKAKRSGNYREKAFKAVAKKTGLVLKSPKVVAEKDFWLTTDVSVLAKLGANKSAELSQKLGQKILKIFKNSLLALGRVENAIVDWWRTADKRRLTVATILLAAGGLQIYLSPSAFAGLREDSGLAMKFFKATVGRSVLAARSSFENTLNLPADIQYVAENIGKVEFRRLVLATANTSINGMMTLGTETAKSFDQFYRQTLTNAFGFIDKDKIFSLAKSITEINQWRVPTITEFNSGAETLYQTVRLAIKPLLVKQAEQLLAVKPIAKKQLVAFKNNAQEKLCYLPFNNQACEKILPMVAGVVETQDFASLSSDNSSAEKTVTATGTKILASVGGSISSDWQTIKETTALMSRAASRAPDYLFKATKDLSYQSYPISWLLSRLGKGLGDFYDLSFGAFNNQLEKFANLSTTVYQTIKNDGIPVMTGPVIVKQPTTGSNVNGGSTGSTGSTIVKTINTVEKVVYVTGPAGPKGDKGDKGEQGIQGSAGTNGLSANPVSLITPPNYNYKDAPIFSGNLSMLDNLSIINYLTVGRGGIGTGGPLNVAGSANFASGTNNTFTVGSPATFSGSLTASSGLDVTGGLTVAGNFTSASAVTLDDDLYVAGNVGIGTTTPAFKLDVNGIVNATALYVNGSPYLGSQWTTSGDNIYYSDGNIGIGTSTPYSILSVSTTTQSSLPLLTVASTTNATLFTVLAGGNVGIGTANPGFTLDVNGIVNATALYVSGSPYIGSQWTTSGDNIYFATGTVGIGTSTLIASVAASSTDKVTAIFDQQGTDDILQLQKAGTTLLKVTDDGFVGVGTSTPFARLSVSSLNQSSLPLLTVASTTNATLFTVLAKGNVGIGTVTPDYSLTIEGTDAIKIPVGNTAARPAGVPGLVRFNSQTNTFEGYNNSVWSGLGGLIDLDQDTYILAESTAGADEDALTFFTANKQQAIIDANGRMGIGTSSATNLIAQLSASSTNYVTAIFDQIGSNDILQLQDNGTTVFKVVDGGKVSVGGGTPSAWLHLQAGDTAVGTAPLKFTSGALLDTPEVGAIEFNNDKWYGTITGADRQEFAFAENVVAGNVAIVGATKTKITYDSKGLVTSGADATTADIADSADKRYVTDADLIDLGNLSGSNTGDQTITLTGDVTGTGNGSFETTIGANRVTLAMQATLPANTIIGNDTAGALTPKALTAAEVRTLLNTDGLYLASSNLTSNTLLTALSDETGTGLAVFSTSPTFSTQITTPSVVGATTLSITSNTSNALTLDSGTTGTINIGTGTDAKIINLGASATGAKTINIGNTAGAGNITIGGTGAHTGTIAIGSGTGAQTISLGNGSGVKTISIGGSGATNAITIGNLQTAGSIAMGAAMTTGTITIGGTGAQTGTISIGTGTGAQTINIGTGGTAAKDIRVATGINSSTLTIGNSSWFRAVDSTGASTANILRLNDSDEIELGSVLSMNGYMTAPEDFGAIYLFNAPVSATADGPQSVSIGIDYNSILTVYSEPDGAGSVKNMRVGIGTTTPSAKLFVHAGATDVYDPALFTITSSTAAYATSTLFTVLANGNTGVGTSTIASALAVSTFGQQASTTKLFAVASTTGTILFQVLAGGAVEAPGGTNVHGADVAENYPSLEKLEAGDLVMADPNNEGYIIKTTGAYNNNVIGVISEKPGLLMGSDVDGYPVALVGRIPTKVTAQNGAIKAGDTLTIAPIPGYAMKLQEGQAGLIIGTALANFDGSTGETGRISMFVNPDYKTTFDELTFGQITDGQIATNASINDSKLAQITTAGKIAMSALPTGIALLQGDTQNFLGNYIFGRPDNSQELLVFNSSLGSDIKFASNNQFKVGSALASAANIYSTEMNASRLIISEDLIGLQNVGQQKYGLYVSASSGLAYFGDNAVVGQLADFNNVLPQYPEFALNGGDLVVVDDLGVGGGLFVAGNLRVAGVAEFAKEGTAQLFSTTGEILEGEIAVIDPENAGQVRRSFNANAQNILGVVATSAAQIFGSRSGLTNPQPIIISGLTKVKVSAVNGPIKAGDKLTTADTDGVAMLATRPGAGVLGFAMENLSEGEGEIKVFVEPGVYFQPLARIVTVGESGSDFKNITDALNSITDNAPNLPYIIKVAPGTYNEQIVLKDYVAIVGEDKNTVAIESDQSPLVTAGVNTRLENVSLRLSGAENEPLLLSLSGTGASGTATILRDISLESETINPATGISLAGTGANIKLSRLNFSGNFSQGVGMFGAGQKVTLSDSEIIDINGKAVIVASGQLKSSFNKFAGTLGDIYVGLGARVESRADDYRSVENLGLFLDTTNRGKIEDSYIDFGWLATKVASSPLMVDISSGSGYINGVKVSTPIINALAVLPNSINYLFMNDEGSVSVATTTANVGKDVLIAQVETDASDIVKIVNDRKNEIVVAKEGGQFLTISDAINSIAIASSGNRWTINVRPGVYVEPIIMKPFIDIVGSGDATVLTANNQTVVTADFVPSATSTIITTGATTTPSMTADLKNLKVIMTGDVVGQAVVESKSANLNLENVKLEWSGSEDNSETPEIKGSGISISGESKVNLDKVDISGSATGILVKADLAKFATTTVDIAYSQINSTENDIKTACFQDSAEVDCPEPVEGEAPFNSGITVYSAYNILKGSGYNFWTSRGAVISSSHDTYLNYGGDGEFVQNDYFRNLTDPNAVVFNLQNAGLDLFTVTATGTVAINPQNAIGDSVIINSATSGSALTVINSNAEGIALTVKGSISAGGGTIAIGTAGDTIDLSIEGVNYKFKENVRRNTMSAYSKAPVTGDQMWGSSDNAWSPSEGITVRALKVQYACSEGGALEIILRAKDGTEIARLNSNSCSGWDNVVADNLDYHLTPDDGLYAEFVNATEGLTDVTVSVDFVYDND